ncbi:hypothetical protein E3U23_09765 [Erythrobacter litoralis]|uniref:hypothetical protein n=1 Tax=Erythrobacter litoralis TaxID=39960 RepID=UPI002434ADAD|nr:hypothetical protein [Erythrobacter litoralis]MDG6079479.1 hypothetical protein [Erythrobacter litoralis]
MTPRPSRPVSVRAFDSLYLGSIALNVANVMRDWDANLVSAQEELAGTGLSPSILLAASMAFFIGLSLILWLMAAHLRVGFVRYLLIGLLVWQALPAFALVQDDVGYSDLVVLLSLVLQAVALAFAFRRDARAWFKGTTDGGQDPLG